MSGGVRDCCQIMKLNFAPLLSVAFLFASVSPLLADGKSYVLKLHHDAVKGQKSQDHYKVKSTTSQKVLVAGNVVQEEVKEFETEAIGVRETLEVSPHKKPTQIKFTVEKFLHKTNEESGSKLKQGAVIIGKLGEEDKETFTVDGEDPDADLAEALALIFEMSPDGEKKIDDDTIFNTKEPHEVGTTWSANVGAIIDSMPEDLPFELEEKDAKGSVKFPAIKTEQGLECAEVVIEANLKPKKIKGMPPELKPKRAEVKVTEERLVPLDGATPTLTAAQKMDFTFSGTMTTPEGGEAKIEVGTVLSRSLESKLLK